MTIRAGRRRADHLQSGAAGGGDHHGGVAHREDPALGGDRAAKLDVTANAVKGTIAMIENLTEALRRRSRLLRWRWSQL